MSIHADEAANEHHPYLLLNRWFVATCIERNPYSRACDQQPERRTAEANARLIAAAPELLKALRQLCDEMIQDDVAGGRMDNWSGRVQYQNARAAIAKATGGAP